MESQDLEKLQVIKKAKAFFILFQNIINPLKNRGFYFSIFFRNFWKKCKNPYNERILTFFMTTETTQNLDTENEIVLIQKPDYLVEIAEILTLQNSQVETILALTAEGATVPFIARYRKEKTGNLDEDQIRDILKEKTRIENLYEAKKTALNGIFEQGKLTDELKENILKAKTLKEVEDIYKPYKSKKKTKAMIAIENGFQIVADEIKKNKNISENDEVLKTLLADFSFAEIIE